MIILCDIQENCFYQWTAMQWQSIGLSDQETVSALLDLHNIIAEH